MTAEVKVIFRVARDGGECFALFPTIPSDAYGTLCTCYQHIGQHCAADYRGCIAVSRPAFAPEYADLAEELRRIGYNLAIRRRADWRDHRDRINLAMEQRKAK